MPICHDCQDFDIIVSGLTEETDYPYIYCYAEDAWGPGIGRYCCGLWELAASPPRMRRTEGAAGPAAARTS